MGQHLAGLAPRGAASHQAAPAAFDGVEDTPVSRAADEEHDELPQPGLRGGLRFPQPARGGGLPP
eukprot:6969952-Lingulodinium_polyedra.AAC.1